MAKTDGKILVVDDDADVLITARMFLKQQFTVVQTEKDPRQLPRYLNNEQFDVILLDMNFEKGDSDGKAGIHWLNRILEINPTQVVILITAYGEVNLAVQAIKSGATDFVVKPWKNERLLATISSAMQLSRSKSELEKLQNLQQKSQERLQVEFVGKSKPMQQVFSMIDKVADTDANVLILGENGTGKELVARSLHAKSARANKTFLSVDLGAISESLFESELFGHVKGAFTDAKADRAGSFEVAQGGTIFLDEIGNLSLALQMKLLTVIQNRVVRRVGSHKPINTDVRLICATNMPLYEMVGQETFRQDLLYRINTVEIRLPSLRERTEDIPILAEHFLQIYGKKYKKSALRVEQGALAKLKKHDWPGNVRELQHAVERAVILCEGSVVKTSDFFPGSQVLPQKSSYSSEARTLDEMEQQFIREALERNHGNVTKTAKELGLTRTALYRRLHKYGL